VISIPEKEMAEFVGNDVTESHTEFHLLCPRQHEDSINEQGGCMYGTRAQRSLLRAAEIEVSRLFGAALHGRVRFVENGVSERRPIHATVVGRRL
jgi:hypothetical protein